jgi:hypothetical protein
MYFSAAKFRVSTWQGTSYWSADLPTISPSASGKLTVADLVGESSASKPYGQQ